jgi:hypothetical protein
MSEPTKHFSTIGYMCQLFQRSPAWVESKLRDLRAEPSMELNGLKYYNGETHDAVLGLLCGLPVTIELEIGGDE